MATYASQAEALANAVSYEMQTLINTFWAGTNPTEATNIARLQDHAVILGGIQTAQGVATATTAKFAKFESDGANLGMVAAFGSAKVTANASGVGNYRLTFHLQGTLAAVVWTFRFFVNGAGVGQAKVVTGTAVAGQVVVLDQIVAAGNAQDIDIRVSHDDGETQNITPALVSMSAQRISLS
jgi:hypothetical protein